MIGADRRLDETGSSGARVAMLDIVIPTMNRPEALGRLLESLRFDGDHGKLVNLIVVDDCSDEPYRTAVKALAHQYSCVTWVFLKARFGGGVSRNVGASRGRAEWLWFIDDDDTVSVDTIRAVLAYLLSPGRRPLVLLPAFRVDSSSRHLRVVPNGEQLFDRLVRHGQQVNTSCSVVTRDLFSSVGGWDPTLVAGQDTDMFLRLSQQTDADVLESAQVLVDRRGKDRAITDPRRQIKGKIQFLRKHYRVLRLSRTARYLLSILFMTPYWARLFR